MWAENDSLDIARLFSYFVAYEVLKKRLTPAGSTDLSLPAVMAAGAGAGVAMWSIAIPPDVSRMTCMLAAYLVSNRLTQLTILARRSSNLDYNPPPTVLTTDLSTVSERRSRPTELARSGRDSRLPWPGPCLQT